MKDNHKNELNKLYKKYKILKKINTFLLCCVGLLLILILLESINIINVPFYEQRLPLSHRIFLNSWVGIPYMFIEIKMKKIDKRIREIESMYEKEPHKKQK